MSSPTDSRLTPAVGDVVEYDSPSWGRVRGRVLMPPRGDTVLIQDLTPTVVAREYWPLADIRPA